MEGKSVIWATVYRQKLDKFKSNISVRDKLNYVITVLPKQIEKHALKKSK